MKLIRTLLPLMTAFLLMNCGPSGNSFTIEGEFTAGMKGGELYLFNPYNPEGRIDTLAITNGRFHYEGETEDTLPLLLLFPNALEHVIFVSPAKEFQYRAAANDLKNYQVTGSEENELMNQFRQETSRQKDTQILDIAKRYITDHATSPVALYLFERYFIQAIEPKASDLVQMQKLLKKHHPNNRLLFSVEGLLKNAQSLNIGNKVPNVSLKQRSKEMRKLWTQSTKDYTLIFFWATWIPNSYDMLWKVRQIQEDNSEKMRSVGISLDNERYRWEDLTKRDSLLIEHYCDGLVWSSPAVQELGLNTIPYYVITDHSHKVLKTGTNMEQMEKDIKQYVK
ncbi:MAG: DUF4369 domain-containing protein [Bacteroidaceae bacterium]|nr:DUF4369 domain-containing protein [Bacteroidaceae bacterium]